MTLPAVEDVKSGQHVIEWQGARWLCACHAHSEDDGPGFQSDCVACEDAVHGLIDHMARVQADRDQAARIRERIARQAARMMS